MANGGGICDDVREHCDIHSGDCETHQVDGMSRSRPFIRHRRYRDGGRRLRRGAGPHPAPRIALLSPPRARLAPLTVRSPTTHDLAARRLQSNQTGLTDDQRRRISGAAFPDDAGLAGSLGFAADALDFGHASLGGHFRAAYVTVMLRVVTDPPGTEVEVAHPCNW
jgi:hypothetical protein